MRECTHTPYTVDLVMMVPPVLLYTADDRIIYQIILNTHVNT
jgi:hypothetical protein